MKKTLPVLVLLAAATATPAAVPPTLVNYQGVLRDAADKPRNGSFNMVFRFFDALTVGNEILVDSHTSGGANAVTVTGGLFSVALGGGTVTDGSGAGSYTSLSDVFRDYTAVYLQITIGAEVLSPRIRIQSAAYALNSSNLAGKPASSFVDTTSTSQTKTGHFIVGGGFEGNNSSGIGVQGVGTTAGGSFFDNSGNTANVASGGYGVTAYGTTVGVAGNGQTGVSGYGNVTGGSFGSLVSTALLATVTEGVHANGFLVGGYFTNSTGDARASLGDGRVGISAGGSDAGGFFSDTNASGAASVAVGDIGISASGVQAGAYFTKPATNAQAYLAASNGFTENGVYGLSYGAYESPSYFVNQYTGAYAYVGYDAYKIVGNGSVNFIQNDPTDPSHVIVYTAPEGDEAAVYTRGTARLAGGTARVALGETFARVANPEIGLTVQLTARGSAVPLAVETVTTSELVVRGPASGPQDLVFDYAVWGLRIGFEDRPVVEPKRQEAWIPAATQDDALYAAQPSLRAYSARQRFDRMERAADPLRVAARSGSSADALKAAIHVYDRNADLSGVLATPTANAHATPQTHARPTEPAPAAPPAGEPATPLPATGTRARSPDPPAQTATAPAFAPSTTQIEVAEPVEGGDVLAAAPDESAALRLASTQADPAVVGIVAGAAGARWTGTAPIALAGSVVLCKVDAAYGAIVRSALLVASPTPGHAMTGGESPRPGTVIGKALESLEAGTGTIRVLVMSR